MSPLLESIIKVLVFAFVALTGFAYLTLLERRLLAAFQARVGPNRAGPLGLLQPLADGLKLIFKESITPSGVDKAAYFLAPILTVVPAIIVFAVVPFGKGDTWQLASKINVGVLYVLGVLGVAVYGITLAGWSSNNKYASLGSLRASAQVISYELPLGLSMVAVVLMAGSASLADIVEAQRQYGEVGGWYLWRQPVAALIFGICVFAETMRAPFDLVEAEQELTAGFMTEYSGMKFALFYMAEYLKMIAVSALFATFFLGGWSGPGVEAVPVLSLGWFLLKVFVCLCLFIWVRASLPRFRYDQLMGFGWKKLLPIALANVVVTALLIAMGIPGYK
jgi:NADH-quinone oxidoreductase subunit H